MTTTTFRYASHRDLKDIFPEVDRYDTKRVLRDWVVHSGSLYRADNCGLITLLFADGQDLGDAEANSGVVDANGEWYYDSDLDRVYYYNDTTNPADDVLMEAGEDFATLINRLLVNGAMELNAMLDARFPIPIPPTFQYSSDPANDTAEHDYVLKRANALITASHLAQTRDMELAENYYRQVTNEENTGIIDRINDGKVKLSFERVENDSEGRIIEITKTGTMSMVELSGDWTGNKYDRVQVICTTGGAYGTAQVTVYSYDGTNLYGNSSTPITVTGGMDYLINGISGRFEGNSLSLNDRWDFEVRRDSVTNPQTGSIELCR